MCSLITSFNLQEFTDKLIEEEELTADQKDAFKVNFYYNICNGLFPLDLTCEILTCCFDFPGFS